MWMYAYRHNYTSKQSICGMTHLFWHGHTCICLCANTLIYRDLLSEVRRCGQNWLQMTPLFMNAVRHILPTSHRNPLFPFMLLVTLLLFRLQSLKGGRHTLKCFPHACRIFIQMCEQGQGSSWSQLPSVYFILDELSVSNRHLGWTKGEAHGDSFSADLDNVNRQGKQMTFTNAENVN